MESPGFSKFRDLMDIYDDFIVEEEEANKLNDFIDGNGLILFFKKGDSYFGAGEDSRVVFARLKNPDEDTPSGWEDDASFTAINLTKLANGEPAQHVFDRNDIKKMKIMDRDKVIDALRDESSETGIPIKVTSLRIIRVGQKDRDAAPNFLRADEE